MLDRMLQPSGLPTASVTFQVVRMVPLVSLACITQTPAMLATPWSCIDARIHAVGDNVHCALQRIRIYCDLKMQLLAGHCKKRAYLLMHAT